MRYRMVKTWVPLVEVARLDRRSWRPEPARPRTVQGNRRPIHRDVGDVRWLPDMWIVRVGHIPISEQPAAPERKLGGDRLGRVERAVGRDREVGLVLTEHDRVRDAGGFDVHRDEQRSQNTDRDGH